jgi:hypothetical protein
MQIKLGLLVGSVLVASLAVSSAAHASDNVIIDQSPDILGFGQANTWLNDDDQNFLVEFTLSRPTTIDGMDIYSATGDLIGQSVNVKIRGTDGGMPAASNLFEHATHISLLDKVETSIDTSMTRTHADFTPTLLGPGTWWIGMSGPGADDIGWSSVIDGSGAPSTQWRLNGDNLDFQPNIDTLAYRIDGAAAVPEPAAWAMTLIGLGGLGASLRTRRRAIAA